MRHFIAPIALTIATAFVPVAHAAEPVNATLSGRAGYHAEPVVVCRVVPVDTAAPAAPVLCIEDIPARLCSSQMQWPVDAIVKAITVPACAPEDCVLNAQSADTGASCAGVTVRSRLPSNDS